METPTLLVEAAFSDPPLHPVDPTWTDITAYVRHLEYSRGRADERSDIDTGTGMIVLDNRDRRFDPEHASSPYVGGLEPGRRLRIKIAAQTVFDAYAEGWNVAYPDPSVDAITHVPLADAFSLFERARLRPYADAVMQDEPVGYWRLGEASGTSAADEGSGDACNGTYGSDVTLAQPGPFPGSVAIALDGSANAADAVTLPTASNTKLRITGDLTLEFWVKPAVVYDNSVPAQSQAGIIDAGDLYQVSIGDPAVSNQARLRINWGDFDGSGLAWITTASALSDTSHWYHIVVVRDQTRRARVYIDGVLDVTAQTAENPATQASDIYIGGNSLLDCLDGAIAHVAIYNKLLGLDRIEAHYKANVDRIPSGSIAAGVIGHLLDAYGWPGLRRNLSGTTVIGQIDPSGTVLEEMRRVGEAEAGMLFVARAGNVRMESRSSFQLDKTNVLTIGDSASEDFEFSNITLARDNSDIYNAAEITRTDGLTQVVVDADSQELHGERVIAKTVPLATDNDTYDFAAWLVHLYADPKTRIREVELKPQRDPARYADLLQRELGDRIQVVRRPPGGGSAITQDAFIQSIKVSWTASDGLLLVTWGLQSADGTDVWLLGDATYGVLGTTTILGF